MFILCQHCFLKQTVLKNGKFVTIASLLFVGCLLKLLNYTEAAVFSFCGLTHEFGTPAFIKN